MRFILRLGHIIGIIPVVFSAQLITAQVPADSLLYRDWKALVALYEATDGENWANNTGWSNAALSFPISEAELVDWHGVTLANQRVATLDLTANQLNGVLPSELANLTALTRLRLGNNELKEAIPGEITNLTQLVELALYRNQLTGSIPSGIGRLTELTYLSLARNNLSGEIPAEIGNLTGLRQLWLNHNDFTGSIPPSWAVYPALNG